MFNLRFIFYLLLFLTFWGLCWAETSENIEIDKSVVMIYSVSQDYDYATPWKQASMSQGVGTGFVIEGNRILTNAHNVGNVKYIILRKENVATQYPAGVLYVGHDCDLALISVADQSFFDGMVPLEFAEIPKVNTTVSTYGFPMGGSRISVTEGVVSRIDMDIYAHSGADQHLVVQTDAAINPGNSGGPVMQDGKVVGVAFQGLRQGDNIGYMIPTTVVKHFIDDINDGKYDGFGSLGIMLYAGLHSNSYRDYLKVPEGEDGIVVTSTLLNSSAEKVFESGDVITEIGGYNVDNDGKVNIYGLRLAMSEVVESMQIGENVEITFYRSGEKKTESLEILLNRGILEYAKQFDIRPRYVCFAGLTFVSVSRNLLESWGSNWPSEIPFYLRYLFNNYQDLNKEPKRKEYVLISTILPDEINSYADDFTWQPLERIDDVEIYSLDDIYKAVNSREDGFYEIKFMGSNRILPVNVNKAKENQTKILTTYNIPQETYLEGQQ